MKNSFEWKKDIDDKLAERRELISKRNAQLRSLSGISLAVLLCLGCSVAVIRFSRINQPAVEGTGDSLTNPTSQTETTSPYPLYADTGFGDCIKPSYTAAVGTTRDEVKDLPLYTAAAPSDTGMYPIGTGECVITGGSSDPVYTGEDIYPSTTGPDAVIWTTLADQEYKFRYARQIINQAYPEKLHFPDATEYEKTFASALEYYGLSDFNIAPVLRTDIDYRIDFADSYTFLADDNGGQLGIIVRDDITVNYVSVNPEVYYQLSMGYVTVPYDWVFTTAESSTLEYRGIKVNCGYLNGDGFSAELIVADYEYNGIKFRFTGHNVIEKEFISCLYNVIDCLFRR